MANQSPEDIRKAFESSTKEVKKFSGSVKSALKEVTIWLNRYKSWPRIAVSPPRGLKIQLKR